MGYVRIGPSSIGWTITIQLHGNLQREIYVQSYIYVQRIKAEKFCGVAKEMDSLFCLELRETGLSHLHNKVLLSVCPAGTGNMVYTKNSCAVVMVLGIVYLEQQLGIHSP